LGELPLADKNITVAITFAKVSQPKYEEANIPAKIELASGTGIPAASAY